MPARAFLIAALAVAFGDIAAGAQEQPVVIDRYRAAENLSYTVCGAFLQNLNAFPPDDPVMVCEARIHPTHPEFSRPVWEELGASTGELQPFGGTLGTQEPSEVLLY